MLTADRMTPDDSHLTVQARKLSAEVEAAQESHMLIEAGMYSDPQALLAVLDAVSRGFGRIGAELAWSGRGRNGDIPMSMWLDTAESVDDRGTLFIPE